MNRLVHAVDHQTRADHRVVESDGGARDVVADEDERLVGECRNDADVSSGGSGLQEEEQVWKRAHIRAGGDGHHHLGGLKGGLVERERRDGRERERGS